MGFHEFVHKTLSEKEQVDTFNDAPPGRKTSFKQEWRALLKVADSFLDEVAEAIAEATSAQDVSLLEETIAELSTYERQYGAVCRPKSKNLLNRQGVPHEAVQEGSSN